MTPREPFADLQAALFVTPSPEFAAGVRVRIAREARVVRRFTLVWGLAAGGALAALAVAIVSFSHFRERPRAVEAGTAQTIAAPVAPPDVAVTAPVLKRTAKTTRVARVPHAPAAGFGEVLVPPDQRIALERLLAAVQTGRATVPPPRGDDVDEDGNWVTSPIPEIAPMKIELLAGTPVENIKLDEIKKEQ